MPDSSYANPSRLLPWFSAGLFRRGLKGPPQRTELALFPNLVSWLARMNARREFPSNGVGARRGAGQSGLIEFVGRTYR